jgi:hypothetical protein
MINMKFFDLMNYTPPQTLDSFVKIFNTKDLQKCIFTYDGFNSSISMELLDNSDRFTQENSPFIPCNSDISDNDYEAYLVDCKEKHFRIDGKT